MIFEPYDYQQQAIGWIEQHPRCALFLDMGLGKTVITLTAVQHLLDACEANRVLVIAPKKVAETTWTDEAAKWSHLSSLRVCYVGGGAKQRTERLAESADVYVVGRDNFVWLAGFYHGNLSARFDMIVVDELTSFKSSRAQRFKAFRLATPNVPRVVGLTGTPAPNGLADLWAQMYCIDKGERLGRSVTKFRDTYFYCHRWNNIIVSQTLRKGCEAIIRKKIADICLSMQAKDYLQLPALREITERVPLSKPVLDGYRNFERERVLEYKDEHADEEGQVLAGSAAALMNKLSQYTGGAVYDEEGYVHELHTEKLERLRELVEAAGSPVLVFYQFKHEATRIEAALGKVYRLRRYSDAADLRAWNAGEVDVLLAHPASTAFGLNMQQGGHYIVWFNTGWNLELYQQANARLHRQGQAYPVTVYRLVCPNTVDARAVEALSSKKSTQQALIDGLNSLLKQYER